MGVRFSAKWPGIPRNVATRLLDIQNSFRKSRIPKFLLKTVQQFLFKEEFKNFKVLESFFFEHEFSKPMWIRIRAKYSMKNAEETNLEIS